MKKSWLLEDSSDVAKKTAEIAQKKKAINWPMASFIYNGSEITTWIGHSLKSKSAKSKATFLKR